MAGGVGNLTVGLGLDAAQFTQGLTKAQAQVQSFAKQVSAIAAGNAIGEKLGGIFDRVIHAFPEMIKGAIDAGDHLNDLSKKTGIAVETLGGIGFAASQAGGDLETATLAAGKLNKSLAEAASGNDQAAEAFQKLGINVLDSTGHTKDAGEALAELADKFVTFRDGPEKVALALRIFGKAGADIIPLLDDGGRALRENINYYKKFGGTTTETARQADEFNDTLGKIKLLSQSFSRSLLSELLPSLQGLADLWLTNKEKGDQFHNAAVTIVEVLREIAGVAVAAGLGFAAFGKAVGANLAIAAAVKTGNFKEAFAISKDALSDLSDAKDNISAVYGAIVDGRKAVGAAPTPEELLGKREVDFGLVDAPRLAKEQKAYTGPKDDPAKKLLENQLKIIDNLIEREKLVLGQRNEIIDLYNAQGLLSIADYYASRQAAQDESTSKEIAGYNQEIAALQKFQSRSSTSQVDRAGAEVKITELVGKRSKAEQEGNFSSLKSQLQQTFALEEYAKTIQSVNAQVLDLGEHLAAAAAIRFDLQNDALSKLFTAQGNEAGLQSISILKAATVAQAQFQEASDALGRTNTGLQNQEERLALAQQVGAIGSLQGLALVGEERRKMIPILEAQVAAEEAIANASGQQKLIDNATQARLALDKLKASADPLAESLNKTFGDDFNTALDDFVTGTKSAADAFKSFAKSVLDDILKLGSKSIAESIFGGSGGAGGLLSGLFGTGSAQGGASGLFSGLSSLFSGFFADGGTIPAGKFGIVGEQGPEFAFGGATGKTIVPNGAGGTTNHINVSVSPAAGMSRDTANQLGVSCGQGVQKALARNS